MQVEMLKEHIYINCPHGILKITCMCIRKKVTEDYPIIIIHKFISTDKKIIRATIITYSCNIGEDIHIQRLVFSSYFNTSPIYYIHFSIDQIYWIHKEVVFNSRYVVKDLTLFNKLTKLIIRVMVINSNSTLNCHRNICVGSNNRHCFSNKLPL